MCGVRGNRDGPWTLAERWITDLGTGALDEIRLVWRTGRERRGIDSFCLAERRRVGSDSELTERLTDDNTQHMNKLDPAVFLFHYQF